MELTEECRLTQMTLYEEEARSQGYHFIAGIDEAGRGPLAGPVLAAACIIPKHIHFPGINDSKQLSHAQREALFTQITTTEGVCYSIASASPQEIDSINILQATIQAMLRAVQGLNTTPDYILVDGLKLPHPTIPTLKIIKGDCKSQSIAAASILAKVTRDRIMADLDKLWPQYGFSKHKGYGTKSHLNALALHGPCDIHRHSFAPIRSD